MKAKQQAWWEAYSNVLEPGYRALITAEAEAVGLQSFEPNVVPGLLQTEDYIRASTYRAAQLTMDTDTAEKLVELRLERQWRLLERADPLQMEVIIDESVLHRQLGGVEVLREQLLHLAKLARLPHITIRVIPLTRPIDYYDFGLCGFVLMKPRDAASGKPGLYCHDIPHGQLFTEEPAEVWRYQVFFRKMWQAALSPERSLGLIENMADRLTRET